MSGDLPLPGNFVSWDDVIQGFRRAHGGTHPLYNFPDGWLNLAAWESEKGHPDAAEKYLAAGLMREAYDRDTYYPPIEYQRLYGPTPASSTPSFSEVG